MNTENGNSSASGHSSLKPFDWAALYGIGLLIYGVASLSIQSPGYMDADYYYSVGLQLVDGHGLTEQFLWNYLDDPTGLPHTAHLYWMPLPSLVAAAGMWLSGLGFEGAQLPFILLAAALPPLSAYFSVQLNGDRRAAWMAGLFAAFPGFYLPFMVTPDSFAIFAVVGSLSLWLLSRSMRAPSTWRWYLAGLLISVGGLARADGLLLLAVGLIAVIGAKERRISSGLMLGLGFLTLMLPWWLRNLSTTGSMLNSGSQRLLWMTDYNDLFAFPASVISVERWMEAGFLSAAQTRIEALLTNIQRLVAEAGIVFLAPFIVVGTVRKWSLPFVRLSILYLAALFAVMTFIFPFVGPRGALFHSTAAVLPLLWALAPIGLKAAIDWLGEKRGWNRGEAWRVLGVGAVFLAAAITIGLFINRFFSDSDPWHAASRTYTEIGDLIPADSNTVVAVNNPPGFFAHSQRAAVAIPAGGQEALRQVVDAFEVAWVVLEVNHPPGLDNLYKNPRSVDWLVLRSTLSAEGGDPVYLMEVVQ